MSATGRGWLWRGVSGRRSDPVVWLLYCEPGLWIAGVLLGFVLFGALPLDAWDRIIADGCILGVAAVAAGWRLPLRAHQLQRALEARLRVVGVAPADVRPLGFKEAVSDQSPRSIRFWREEYLAFMRAPGRPAKFIVGYGLASFLVVLQAWAATRVIYVEHHARPAALAADAVVAIVGIVAVVGLLAERRLASRLGGTRLYPSGRPQAAASKLVSIPLALLGVVFVVLWFDFYNSGTWNSATLLVGFLGLTWTSRSALVRPLSALERLTSPLWPLYAKIYQWLWRVGRSARAGLALAVMLGLPTALVFAADGPPAVKHVASAWSTVFITLWGLQLALSVVCKAWRQPVMVTRLSAAEADGVLADDAVVSRVQVLIWGLWFLLAVWFIFAG